jgi:large subunit ribosomal protein L29
MAGKRTRKRAAAKPNKAKTAEVVAKVSSKADDFRTKTADEMADQLAKLKKEQFNLRFQRANGQLEKTNRIRVVRKDIARIQTIMRERRQSTPAEG